MWIKVLRGLHALGLTNLSDEQVRRYGELQDSLSDRVFVPDAAQSGLPGYGELLDNNRPSVMITPIPGGRHDVDGDKNKTSINTYIGGSNH